MYAGESLARENGVSYIAVAIIHHNSYPQPECLPGIAKQAVSCS